MKVAVIGAGWAGLSAAVRATQDGHQATVFEAARTPGGRARAVPARLPDGSPCLLDNGQRILTLDNGQHILIGAYTDTLRLMRLVGVDPNKVLARQPLALSFPDGLGLSLPDWPSPWDVLAGILRARGWTWRDKLALLRTASAWQRGGFRCPPEQTVAGLCAKLTPRLQQEFIEPLCVSALNTPAGQASGQVFLRVLQDAMFGVPGGSQLLLPRADLGQLFPEAAARWLQQHGAQVRLGERVANLRQEGARWRVNGEVFERAILATPSTEAARLLVDAAASAPATLAATLAGWAAQAQALHFEAITTVYGFCPSGLPQAMLALRSDAANPAQFVFDRARLGGPAGLLAFVVSASQGDRDTVQAQVLAQARRQLGLELQPLQTIVEKRATFACTPGLQRPTARIAEGLLAAGDYVAGPYPATLEGAVRSGWAAAGALQT